VNDKVTVFAFAETLTGGSPGDYKFYWQNAGRRLESGILTAKHIGTLDILGPEATTGDISCTLGRACIVEITGVGLSAGSGVQVASLCDARGVLLDVSGLANPATSQDSGTAASYDMGIASSALSVSSDVAYRWLVCWGPASADAYYVVVGGTCCRELEERGTG
jgi:hypothetical protein